MKTNTKIILSFFGGAAIGSLICFALLKEKYEAMADEEIESMHQYYEGEIKKTKERKDRQINDIYEEIELDHYVDYAKKYDTSSEELAGCDLEEPDDIDEDYHEEEPEIVNDISDMKPFVISRLDFASTYNHFDKINLTYYEKDSVLVDEQDEIIPDIEYVIGYDSLKQFGGISEDEYIVYVRNGKLGSDYEVILAEESYSESVLGILDDPPLNSREGDYNE